MPDRSGPGYIKTAADFAPRPLTPVEADAAFAAMAAMGDRIAFRYLGEGCESRAQVMIDELGAMGIDAGRAWALAVGRNLVVTNPSNPRTAFKWGNHVAPTVALDPTPAGVRVIDPSLPGVDRPVTLQEWSAAMRAKSIEVSEVPLSQAQILELQRARALAGGALDAVVFNLERGRAPIPEKGGSGFRIDTDPPGNVSAFARTEMRRLLALQDLM